MGATFNQKAVRFKRPHVITETVLRDSPVIGRWRAFGSGPNLVGSGTEQDARLWRARRLFDPRSA